MAGFVAYRDSLTGQVLNGRKLGNLLATLEDVGGNVVWTHDGYRVDFPNGQTRKFSLI